MAQPPVVERATGSAAAFHARPLPSDGRVHVWRFDVDRPAIVLGSRQDPSVLDLAACRRAGIEVAHRRSGGGVVLLEPGGVVWIDVVLPVDDPRCSPDVRASMEWMGERWLDALDATGRLPAGAAVHRGGLDRTPWSEIVCFAGVGPGEVTVAGRKLVGISQRRTRDGARFQGALHRRADLRRVVPLLAGPLPPIDELPGVATIADLDADDLLAALTTSIASSSPRA